MSEWKTYKWGDLISLEYGKPIHDKNLLDGQYPVYGTNGKIGTSNLPPLCKHPSIIIGRKGAYRGVHYSNNPFSVIDTAFFVEPKTSTLDLKWAYYKLLTVDINKMDSGSAIPSTDRYEIYSLSVELPPLDEQRRIAGILGSLDDKIELNRRINANLEAQAQALFRSWFVDNDNQLGNYQTKSLTDIAQYLNGLAMQKFPPESIQNSLPVLKIKELGQGLCDASSDRCSTSIKPEYVINDGDVIFSWSGTLLVDVWCGGKCGLNQHLFKVTSDNYPKWFIFYWTKHHLDKFIRIAKDKAVTMGHIKRCDLESSEVKVPEKSILEYLDKIFTPLFDSMITHRIENRKLSALRDTLLPKLMAGEINLE